LNALYRCPITPPSTIVQLLAIVRALIENHPLFSLRIFFTLRAIRLMFTTRWGEQNYGNSFLGVPGYPDKGSPGLFWQKKDRLCSVLVHF
jgi:hypothetical protein